MNALAPSPSARRGVALLIVLAVLMITITTATILVSAAADVGVQRQLNDAESIGADMLSGAEEPIQWWLKHESGKVVLPPTAVTPSIAVLNDVIAPPTPPKPANETEIGETPSSAVRITITAFDQCGMVPMQVARSGSPLRGALPTDVLQSLDAVELPSLSEGTPLGLDAFTTSRATRESQSVVFPLAAPGDAQVFGDVGQDADTTNSHGASDERIGLGALVATHNRGKSRAVGGTGVAGSGGGGAGRINICTAPMPLVEAACRLAGRGDVGQILIARTDGKRPDISQLIDRSMSSDAAGSIPTIVTTSDCWSFRIDITVGSLKRSWWAIYLSGRPAPSGTAPKTPQKRANTVSSGTTPPRTPPVRKDYEWTCVQRFPIDQ